MRNQSVPTPEANRQSPALMLRSWPLILILLLTVFLRFYCLSCSSLWHDEGNTWALMARSLGQIARDAAADIHPPGYYWVLKGWTRLFGTDVWGLRSFSAVAGVSTVAVIYAIGRQVFSGRHWLFPRLAQPMPIALIPPQILHRSA